MNFMKGFKVASLLSLSIYSLINHEDFYVFYTFRHLDSTSDINDSWNHKL